MFLQPATQLTSPVYISVIYRRVLSLKGEGYPTKPQEMALVIYANTFLRYLCPVASAGLPPSSFFPNPKIQKETNVLPYKLIHVDNNLRASDQVSNSAPNHHSLDLIIILEIFSELRALLLKISWNSRKYEKYGISAILL